LTEQLRSLADLLDLHELDRQIDRLLERRGALPELDQYKAADAHVRELKEERDRLATDLRELSLQFDKTSGELEVTEDKANREESRLYAGGMSARDADYLRREVEMLRAKVASMEEAALQVMETRETVEQNVEAVAARLAAAETEEARLEESIKDQWRVIDAEIGAKERRKKDIVPMIEPDLLELYEDLRSDRDGDVVGALDDGICGACHLKLSAAEEARARKEDPPRCIHCRAILVP